jgi:hypothetical protein
MNRTLAWKINWYRQSELEGAILLGRVVRQADEPVVIQQLVRHCADEARHAVLWQDTIERLELPTIRILRSYQFFYGRHGALPASVAEVLALTHIFEQRVWRQFERELAKPDTPPAMRNTLEMLLRDERGHLDWVSVWLAAHAEAGELLERYRRMDEVVYAELAPFEERLWDVPELGIEPSASQARGR